jgi:hypothetical protein
MLGWAAIVYLLCFASSVVCAWLLIRGYLGSRARILLWSAICFVLLAVTNLLVVVDILVLPQVDLIYARLLCSLAAVSTLLYGFIFEVE